MPTINPANGDPAHGGPGKNPRSRLAETSGMLLRAAVLCLGVAAVPTLVAAQSLDMDNGSPTPPPAPVPAVPAIGGLDTDVRADAPIPAAPPGEVKAGITPLGTRITPDAPPSTLAGPDATPPKVEPVTLQHPKVIDTAKLQAGETTVSLFGIEGLAGESAQGLQAYLGQTDKPLNCQARDAAAFVCMMGDGTDVALVALVNGAARTKVEAPEVYREQENDAQKNRRGIWAKLPPPPETVKHPAVKDTATLTADSKTYILDGVIGLGAPYSAQLQSYITANGDSMTCMPQGPQDHFVCLAPDGTDLAKVALVNGAARVPPVAPPAYRTQQLEAVNNKRGYWASAPQEVVAQAVAPPPPDAYTLEAGDDGADGITYAGGVPLAVIDGEPEPVFMVYDDDTGWGYYGHDHYWHRAPDRYMHHLEHFHHEGHGLGGYDHGHYASYGHEFHGRPGEGREGLVHEAGLHAEGRPGMHEGGFHAEGRPGMHEGGMREGGMHAEARGGMAHTAMARPAGGGGFMRPAPQASMGGFHQSMFGGGGGGMRMGGGASAMHASAPAARSGGGGGGGKHK